ncbi:MAG: adenylyltransferase/cytidyltransferase family protein [Candidatus Sungbacteria bacterium]|nr:adenylyltransferase/cytidyltransferase family protein [Candidatus Sungbacteria bacterium]
MRSKKVKPITVAVSGGFDPLHSGHLKLIQAAGKLGDKLVVILNNDQWLKRKKGYVFMPQDERKKILEFLVGVDRVLLTGHAANPKDMSVSAELRKLRPDIFANGGDRTRKNIPEAAICKSLGCRTVFGVGGKKVQSSSWLLEKFGRCGQCQK